MVLLDISALAATGKPKQASDLAQIFSKLTAGLWRRSFNLKSFRDRELALFYARHPRGKIRRRVVVYMQKVNEVLEDAAKDFSKN